MGFACGHSTARARVTALLSSARPAAVCLAEPERPDAEMSDATNASRAASWAEYWSGGALHSCPGSFAGNYDGEISAFWDGCFRTLPNPFVVIDVCTGNGAIPRLLSGHESFRSSAGSVQAFDLAPVSPDWLAGLADPDRARISFLGEVDVSSLPCGEGSADLVTSQFGIEYVGEPAFREVARVLRRGGRLAAVLHHPDGLPVAIAKEELAHHAWLEARGWEDTVAGMIEPMARSATPAGRAALGQDASAQQSRRDFDAVLAPLRDRAAASAYPDLLLESWEQSAAVFAIARERGADAARMAWQGLGRKQAHAALRQQELVDCAADQPRLQAWASLLGDAAPELGVLRFHEGSIAGWRLGAVRG